MNHDISLDIETLSTRADAAILSIGAAEFDRNTGVVSRTMYVEIDIADALKHGHVDGATLSWWMQQDEAARRLLSAGQHKVPLADALGELSEFIGDDDVCVWGNGATFDISILESAFQRTLMRPAPWHFWYIRDMRTLVDIAKTRGFQKSRIPFIGTPHHALYDANHQARVIAAAWAATQDDFEPNLESSDIDLEEDLIAVAAHALEERTAAIAQHDQMAERALFEEERAIEQILTLERRLAASTAEPTSIEKPTQTDCEA